MVWPFGGDGEGLLLHVGKVDPAGLKDGEGCRGLGAAGDVHLFRCGQLHGVLQRRLKDAPPSAGKKRASGPAGAEESEGCQSVSWLSSSVS